MSHGNSDNPTGILEGPSQPKHYVPTQEEREEAGCVFQKFTEFEQWRRPYDYVWEFDRLFLKGNQYIGRDPTTNEVLRVSRKVDDKGRAGSTENILRSTARACVGKLTRIIPTCEVLPRTDDQSELRAAVIATSFLDYISVKESLRVKYKQGAESLMWAGTTVYHVCWDRRRGRDLAWCKQCFFTADVNRVGEPCRRCEMQFELEAEQSNMQRQQMFQQIAMSNAATGQLPPEPPPMAEPQQAMPMEKMNEGDIRVDRLDLREFFPEPGVSDPRKMRCAFIRTARPVSDLRAEFFEHAEHIKSQDGIYTDRTVVYYGGATNVRSETTYLRDHAYHIQYFEAPSAKHPDGQIIHYVNDIVVRKTPNYYWKLFKRLPFFFNWFERSEGELYGDSPVRDAWMPQRERNRLRTQIREWRELSFRPRLLKPQNSSLGIDELDAKPGRIFSFNAFAGKPSFLETPPIPQYVYEDLVSLETAIRRPFGVTDQEVGTAGGDPSGRYAAIQEAQSNESIAPIFVENNDEWKELHRAILLLGQHYYTEDRMWTVYGKERVYSNSFAKANLSPGWDIQISETDSLSKNPAIRQEQVRSYLADGVFTDPRTGAVDYRTYMRVAGIRLPGAGPDIVGAEHAYAASIPERVMRGEPFQPQPWDDARIMCEELLAWLRGPGRTQEAPADVVMMVGQIYMYYLQLLQVPELDLMGSPGTAPGQPAQAAGPNGFGAGAMPGQQPTGQPAAKPAQQGGVAQNAAAIVQNADRAGEALSRGASKPHEG